MYLYVNPCIMDHYADVLQGEFPLKAFVTMRVVPAH